MSYSFNGLGSATTTQVYICTTGACVPWEIAKACAGDGNRWRELIALNPGKLTSAGTTSSYHGWLNIPSGWACPGNYTTRSSDGGAASPALPAAPVPGAPAPLPTPGAPAPETIITYEHDEGVVVPTVALLLGGVLTAAVVYLAKGKRSSTSSALARV